jgi:beta-barrel assembly-enhancing protease
MMNRLAKIAFVMAVVSTVIFVGCKDDEGPCSDLGKVGGFLSDLAFPVSGDVVLGAQVAHQIDSTYAKTILPPASNQAAYAYLNAIKDEILLSEDIVNKDVFEWKLTIIDEDVLNAFATPGGYIYVYTGLIKYLDNVDDLAGVMGHEIAHADRRHSINQYKKTASLSILSSIILGDDAGQIAQVAGTFATNIFALSFSREDEAEADAASVEYLDETKFACDGTASFFKKITEAGGDQGPEFLSTHPSSESRVTDIEARATCRACNTTPTTAKVTNLTYAQFKALFK